MRSKMPACFAVSMVQAIRGFPPSGRVFLPGSPLEPLRAGTSASLVMRRPSCYGGRAQSRRVGRVGRDLLGRVGEDLLDPQGRRRQMISDALAGAAVAVDRIARILAARELELDGL